MKTGSRKILAVCAWVVSHERKAYGSQGVISLLVADDISRNFVILGVRMRFTFGV